MLSSAAVKAVMWGLISALGALQDGELPQPKDPCAGDRATAGRCPACVEFHEALFEPEDLAAQEARDLALWQRWDELSHIERFGALNRLRHSTVEIAWPRLIRVLTSPNEVWTSTLFRNTLPRESKSHTHDMWVSATHVAAGLGTAGTRHGLQLLSHRDPKVQFRALLILAWMKGGPDEGALDTLIDQLRHGNDRLSELAATALGAMGSRAAPAMPALIAATVEAIHRPNDLRAQTMVQAMAEIREPAELLFAVVDLMIRGRAASDYLRFVTLRDMSWMLDHPQTRDRWQAMCRQVCATDPSDHARQAAKDGLGVRPQRPQRNPFDRIQPQRLISPNPARRIPTPDSRPR